LFNGKGAEVIFCPTQQRRTMPLTLEAWVDPDVAHVPCRHLRGEGWWAFIERGTDHELVTQVTTQVYRFGMGIALIANYGVGIVIAKGPTTQIGQGLGVYSSQL
jgi:hypothetical protein